MEDQQSRIRKVTAVSLSTALAVSWFRLKSSFTFCSVYLCSCLSLMPHVDGLLTLIGHQRSQSLSWPSPLSETCLDFRGIIYLIQQKVRQLLPFLRVSWMKALHPTIFANSDPYPIRNWKPLPVIPWGGEEEAWEGSDYPIILSSFYLFIWFPKIKTPPTIIANSRMIDVTFCHDHRTLISFSRSIQTTMIPLNILNTATWK